MQRGYTLIHHHNKMIKSVENLNKDDEIIVPKEAHLLVAKGAVLDSLTMQPISVEKLKSKIQVLKASRDNTTQPLQPLFKTNVEYEEFKKRHEKDKGVKTPLAEHKGDCCRSTQR